METPTQEKAALEVRAQEGHERWKSSRIVIKSEELTFKTSSSGTVAQHVSPANGFANRQISGFIREIPPGWKSGRHRHNMEAIIHVLEGRGYTEIDGVKFEWSAGDTISVPPMSEHQHFNLEMSRRVRLFAVHTASLMSNIGSFDFVPTGNAGRIEDESV